MWPGGRRPGVVFHRRDAHADEFRVDPRRKSEVPSGDGRRRRAKQPEALLATCCRAPTAPQDASVYNDLLAYQRATGVDRFRRAAAGKGSRPRDLILGSAEYQFL